MITMTAVNLLIGTMVIKNESSKKRKLKKS